MVKILLILSLLFYQPSFAAQCEKPVEHLKSGQIAPCDGYLFSPEMEQQVRIIKETDKLKDSLIEKQEKQLDIYDVRLRNHQDHILELTQEMQKREKDSFWEKAGYFSLGAALTTLIVYGIKQATK